MGNSISNNPQIHFEGDYLGNIHYKVLGEYLSTSEVLNSITDNIENDSRQITPDEFIRQYKLMSIVKSLPVIEVNAKYLEAIRNKHQEEDNKRCIICMEEYELKTIIKTLPCCIYIHIIIIHFLVHVFHMKCIDEWLLNNGSCPICKTSLEQEM